MLLGASPAPEETPAPEPSALPSPAPSARCPGAAEPVARFAALDADPDADVDDAVAAASSVSDAYALCAAFAAARGNLENLHDMQVRSAYYHYAAGRLYFIAEAYSQAHAQLDAARGLVAETIADNRSAFRAQALAVRDAATGLIRRIPVPTGVSTAPAITPATALPK